MPVRIGTDRRTQRHSALPGAFEGCGAVGVAKPHAARTGHGEGLLGASRDRLALGLGDEGHDAHGQIIGLRQIDGYEPHAAVAQGQEEGGIAGQAVQLRDDQSRARQP